MRQYAKKAEEHLHDGDSVLEIAPGPGLLSIELAKLGNYKIVGMDISSDFVDIARKNAREADAHVEFRQVDVSDMPFPDNTFDFIFCTAAFKNFDQPLKALNEMNRVLKMEGTALIIDLKRNVSAAEINAMTKKMEVKGIESLFMRVTFKYFLRKGAYTSHEMRDLIHYSRFRHFEVLDEGVDLCTFLNRDASSRSSPLDLELLGG